MASVAYVASTNELVLRDLRSGPDGGWLNAAVVTATITDRAGQPVPGMSWPVGMEFVEGSTGDYATGLSHLLALAPGKKYVAVIHADASSGGVERVARWEFGFQAQTRTS
jgi:hypothetical protein